MACTWFSSFRRLRAIPSLWLGVIAWQNRGIITCKDRVLPCRMESLSYAGSIHPAAAASGGSTSTSPLIRRRSVVHSGTLPADEGTSMTRRSDAIMQDSWLREATVRTTLCICIRLAAMPRYAYIPPSSSRRRTAQILGCGFRAVGSGGLAVTPMGDVAAGELAALALVPRPGLSYRDLDVRVVGVSLMSNIQSEQLLISN